MQSRRLQITHPQSAAGDEIHQPLGTDTAGIQKMEGFGQHRDRRTEGFFDHRQLLDAPVVVAVRRIEERHQWPGIHQNHRECFRRMTSASADLASRAGAMA